jgi:heme/copper-type cytochrome/quinol oxidase subunit 1
MGITYWLVPVLRRRGLWNKRLALTQAWLWFFGMTLFSFALHDLGMLGMPRRSMISLATYVQPSWRGVMPLVAIGGSVMFLSAMLYFLNLLMTQNWRGLRYRDTGYHEKVLKNQRSCIFWKVSKPQNIQEPATCGDAHAYPEPYTTFSLPSSPFFAARKRDTLSSSAGS